MSIRILTIPGEISKWPNWLEEQLVGLHLLDVVEELEIVSRNADLNQPLAQLNDVFTEAELSDVIDVGLAPFAEKLHLLFANPKLLLDLQEHIFVTGSAYWSSISQKSDAAKRTRELRSGLQAEILKVAAFRGGRLGFGRNRFFLSISTLAAVLLLVVIFWTGRNQPSGRILGTPGLTIADVDTVQAYLDRIAAAANTWFEQTPRDSEDLQQLLSEVSRDCQILIDADHEILRAEKLSDGTTARDWFITKCRKWKGDFDQTLANLKSGSIDVETARFQANATMTKLVTVLQSGPSA